MNGQMQPHYSTQWMGPRQSLFSPFQYPPPKASPLIVAACPVDSSASTSSIGSFEAVNRADHPLAFDHTPPTI